jgi:hypothetical protein
MFCWEQVANDSYQFGWNIKGLMLQSSRSTESPYLCSLWHKAIPRSHHTRHNIVTDILKHIGHHESHEMG